jgi:hypothetical protein
MSVYIKKIRQLVNLHIKCQFSVITKPEFVANLIVN